MENLATESLELLLLMGGGGLLSVAGFWLMLKEGPGGAGAKIGLGNLQISASSAGFAVFFTGLATFSAPIVAPNSTHEVIARIAPASLRPGSDPSSFIRAGGHFGMDDEPRNDRMEGATLVELGQLVGGTHSGTDVDWFKFDLSQRPTGQIEVEISEGASGCRASFFDGEKRYLGLDPLDRGRNTLQVVTAGMDDVFVKLDCAETAGIDSYTITYSQVLN